MPRKANNMASPLKFRKKPVVIEAIQYTGPNINDVAKFVGDEPNYSPNSDFYEIETLEGDMRADHGDWIIRGVQGEFYPCKPDIFEATYEREVTPERQALIDLYVDGKK